MVHPGLRRLLRTRVRLWLSSGRVAFWNCGMYLVRDRGASLVGYGEEEPGLTVAVDLRKRKDFKF